LADQYKGISFPFRIGIKGGVVMSVANINDFTHIDESITQIIETKQGERAMEPEIYSEAELLLFEPNDESLQGLLEFQITEVLERLEPRIEVDAVNVSAEDEKVFAEIVYSVPEFNGNSNTLTVKIGGE
jgi:phage baseplate assembly protein W